ncbi:MAG TPA: flagella basal body P-ring formation protein FlgA [Edaphobacter sp.]|nr:flagella basal body P-ring formation protein FlgA [Edaphobacter sp.]
MADNSSHSGFWSCLRYVVLFALLTLFVAPSSAASISGGAVCAQTPTAALKLAQGKIAPTAEGKGYRVIGISWDPVLRQNRATVQNCEHPEWPALSISTGSAAQPISMPVNLQQSVQPSAITVHAGEVVRLWRHENMLRIETTGIAEQGGVVGAIIRVRLLRSNPAEASPEKEISGTVRGPQSVEMQP